MGITEQARGESCPSGQRRCPAAPGEDKVPCQDQKYFHIPTTPTNRSRKRGSPDQYRPAMCGNPNATGWLLIGWSSRSQRAARIVPRANVEDPPHPGEDKGSSPDEKSFHTSTTLTARGQKRRSHGSIPPYTVRKPQPHWLIADWLGLMKPACGESWPSRQRRGPAAPGEDKVSSPDDNSFYTCLLYTSPSPRD